MKKTICIHYDGHQTKQQQINYIPIRYIIAILLAVLETVAVIAIVMLLSYYVPYFYLAMWVTEIAAIIHIIASDGNADYKIPWLIVVMVIPVGGLMLFIMFGSRKLKKKYIRRLEVMRSAYQKDDTPLFQQLEQESVNACAQARTLQRIANCHIFTNTTTEYFPLGEQLLPRLLADLRKAETFIFMEYFIIEEGKF